MYQVQTPYVGLDFVCVKCNIFIAYRPYKMSSQIGHKMQWLMQSEVFPLGVPHLTILIRTCNSHLNSNYGRECKILSVRIQRGLSIFI